MTRKNSCASYILATTTQTVLIFFVTVRTFSPAQTPQQPSSTIPAQKAESPRPDYKQLRYDEDWSSLRDRSQRTEYLDGMKYIPFGHREDCYLTLGGEVRPYYEWFRNEDWGAEPKDNNGFLLQRYMFHADLHLGKSLRVFGQLKSGIQNGRNGGPRPPDEDKLDVHQAFADLTIQSDESRSIVLRFGRQELSLGSQRLISTREGPNVRASFDGVRLLLKESNWKIDAFFTKPVKTNRGFFDDSPDHAETFWGVYAVRPLSILPLGGNVDLYYLGLDKKQARFDQGEGRESRHSIGTRLWSASAPIDYNLELVYQFGAFHALQNGDLRAWTVASDIGYKFRLPLKPRLGLKANATSGDKDPNDPDLETFNPLFPKGNYFGQLTPVGPRNHRDLHPDLSLTLLKNVSLIADWVFYWRQSTRDAVYGVPGNIQRTGQLSRARFIGHQPGIEVNVQVDRHTTISFDIAKFIVGPFLRETPPGENTSYFAAWVTYKF